MADEALPSQEHMLNRLQDIMKEETESVERQNAKDEAALHGKPKDSKKLFGLIELSPQMDALARLTVDWADPYVRLHGEKFIKEAGDVALAKVLKTDPKKARDISTAFSNAVGWGYVMKRPFIGGFNSTRGLKIEREELAERLQPVLRSEGIMQGGHSSLTKAGLDGNEILQVEHDRMGSHFKYNMYRDVGAEMIVTAPQILLKRRSNAERDALIHDASKPDIGESQSDFMQRQSKEVLELQEQLTKDGHKPETVQTFVNSHLEGNSAKQPKKGKAKLSDDALQSIGPVVGAVGTATMRQNISSREKANTQHLQETALDKIEKIYEQALDKGKVKTIEGKPLKTYVKDIFQTHQKNMGQKHVGERLTEKFDYAAEQIAEAIERGRMHPMALVHLVGERMIVKKDGKVIASRAEIDEALDAMCEKMPAKFDVDADEYLGESTMTEVDIKHILTNLTGQARDLFVEIIPDEVLMHVGLTEEDIHSTHLRNKKEFGKLLTTALMDIASMSEEELKAAHLNDDEIKMVYDLAEKGKTGDIKSVLAAVSTHGEFNKGVEWPLASMKDYWMEVANGERQIGEEYKKHGEELVPERIAREAEEAKAAKEAEKKAEEKLSKDTEAENDSDEKDKPDKEKPSLAHESKLMSDKMNPFDEADAANDESFDMPDNAITDAAHHDKVDMRESAIGGR